MWRELELTHGFVDQLERICGNEIENARDAQGQEWYWSRRDEFA
jgi:hypothetical protein